MAHDATELLQCCNLSLIVLNGSLLNKLLVRMRQAACPPLRFTEGKRIPDEPTTVTKQVTH